MTKHIDSQFGFTAASSTLHAEVVIRDTLRYYNKNDTPIYMCSLDTEKAIGSLYFLNLPKKTFQHLSLLSWSNGSAHVHYISSRSATFSLTQGVRQGGILSLCLHWRFHHQHKIHQHNSLFLENRGLTVQQSLSTAATFLNKIVCSLVCCILASQSS